MDDTAPGSADAEDVLGAQLTDQLARTLFDIAGTVAQARYVATRIADPQLGGALRRLIVSGEAAEDLLRQRMAAAWVGPGPALAASPRWAAGKIAAPAALAASALAATAAAAAFAWGKLEKLDRRTLAHAARFPFAFTQSVRPA